MQSAVAISGAFDSSHVTPDNKSFTYSFNCSQYIVTYTEDFTYQVKSQISITRNKTTDAIYDIIALPYPIEGTVNIHNSDASVSIDMNKQVAMSAITSIATALGGGGAVSKIYDVQLLPYCPIQTSIDEKGILIDSINGETHEFDYIVDASNSNAKIGALFYVPESKFTFDINKQVYWDPYKIILGFTDIDVLPTPYSTFKQNIPYVIPSIENPTPATTVTTTIRALDPNTNDPINAITCNKISKKTGAIIDTAECCTVSISFYTNLDNILSCSKYIGAPGNYSTV